MHSTTDTFWKSYWAAKLAETGRAQADETCHRSKVTFQNIAGWYGVDGQGGGAEGGGTEDVRLTGCTHQ